MITASQLHGSNRKQQEYLAGWQRAQAELDNYRKRVLKEQAGQQLRTKEEIILPLMALADNFNVMAKHVPEDLSDNAWAQGVLHIARQLDQLLSDYGVRPIKAQGEKFDPALHEAVEQSKKSGVASGRIIEVIQTGYTMGERVVRPAKVKVAK